MKQLAGSPLLANRSASRSRDRTTMARIYRRVLRLSAEEASFERRGFTASDAGRQARLEQIGETFIFGYNAALDHDPDSIAESLEPVRFEDRGFAYEGAAMAYAVLDALRVPGFHELPRFLASAASPHLYMAHVGAGWAMSRMPWLRRRLPNKLDDLLRWLAYDGWGFCAGYFQPVRTIRNMRRPHVDGYEARTFDQGVGRAIWFVAGASISETVRLISNFPTGRQSDLWAGLGLAVAYAGGVDRSDSVAMRDAAGSYRPAVAQGVAFAAEARSRAGNPAPHTEIACSVHCGMRAEDAARLVRDIRGDLSRLAGLHPNSQPYELWRAALQTHFSQDARRLP